MSKGTKTPYAKMLPVAQHIVKELRPFCHKIEIAGSIRRQRKMIGDIEIVARPVFNTHQQRDLFGNVVKSWLTCPLHDFLVDKVELTKGEKADAKYKAFQYGRHKVDLFLPPTEANWGTIFLIRTGSHDFNTWIMSARAKEVGVKFAGGLLYHRANNSQGVGELIETKTEKAVFDALHMGFVPPEMRDDDKWMGYIR